MSKFFKRSARALSRHIKVEIFKEEAIKTWSHNDWTYTFQETCKGLRCGATDPSGHFYGYVTLPGRNHSPSPN